MYILIKYNYDDSRDTGENMLIRDLLLFKAENDAKKYIEKMFKATEWKTDWCGRFESIRIQQDLNRFTIFHLYERSVFTKAQLKNI